MKQITCFLTLLALFFHTNYNAQNHEFLKVPKLNNADLSKEKSFIDKEAPAEILYRSLYYWIDTKTGELVKEIFYRIKIYDKAKAKEWLDVEIPIHMSKNGYKETLYGLKAYVYNIENGKKNSLKVDKHSKYKSEEDKYTDVTKFTFPDVKNGSIIEYQYKIRSPFLYVIPTVYINLDIPSIYTEYILESPDNNNIYYYNLNYTGGLIPNYKKIKKNGDFIYAFAYKNIPPFKRERFVKNNNNYRTKIKAELHSTYFGKLKLYSSNWKKIKESLYKRNDFGTQLKKQKLVKKLLPENILSKKTDLEKADEIFNFVKKNYTWNGKLSVFTENGIRKTIAEKTGNMPDINFLLLNMFRQAGLEANPMIISTVSHGMVNYAIPNISNFNAVLVCLDVNGKLYIYDATAKQSSRDMLPPRDWNEKGVLLTDEKPLIVDLNNNNVSENNMTIKATLKTDGTIKGTYKDFDTGINAMSAKEYYDKNPSQYNASYQSRFKVDFKDIKSEVLENGAFQSLMSFSGNNMVDIVGGKIIMNPMLFLNKNNNEFTQTEKRKYPINFLSAFTRTKTIEIEIPSNYTIVSLPKDEKIATENGEIKYSYLVEQKENKVIITTQIKVASADYPKEYYPVFKQIWKYIVDTQSQVMSLKKK